MTGNRNALVMLWCAFWCYLMDRTSGRTFRLVVWFAERLTPADY